MMIKNDDDHDWRGRGGGVNEKMITGKRRMMQITKERG